MQQILMQQQRPEQKQQQRPEQNKNKTKTKNKNTYPPNYPSYIKKTNPYFCTLDLM
jgi:hypothetical protein